MLERSRLGAEMLDQREETRILASKSEQNKMDLKLREMEKEFESRHKILSVQMRENFESEMVCCSFNFVDK
jgi:hypothetical protein